jgi:cytochrome P450
MNPEWCFKKLYEPFAQYGDTFITVSPTRNIIWTASPEAIHQITQFRDNFPKPLESYKLLDLFGRSVVTVEGMEWRKHRKAIAPGFNEKNNALVFKEAVAQAQSMLRKWTGVDGKSSGTLVEIPTDTMRVALHIISLVGFGVRLLWPGEKLSERERASGFYYASQETPEGHTLSFERALSSLLENIFWLLLLPGWLLSRLHGPLVLGLSLTLNRALTQQTCQSCI